MIGSGQAHSKKTPRTLRLRVKIQLLEKSTLMLEKVLHANRHRLDVLTWNVVSGVIAGRCDGGAMAACAQRVMRAGSLPEHCAGDVEGSLLIKAILQTKGIEIRAVVDGAEIRTARRLTCVRPCTHQVKAISQFLDIADVRT